MVSRTFPIPSARSRSRTECEQLNVLPHCPHTQSSSFIAHRGICHLKHGMVIPRPCAQVAVEKVVVTYLFLHEFTDVDAFGWLASRRENAVEKSRTNTRADYFVFI